MWNRGGSDGMHKMDGNLNALCSRQQFLSKHVACVNPRKAPSMGCVECVRWCSARFKFVTRARSSVSH